MLNCENCGHRNRSGDAYCRKCGQPLIPKVQQVDQTSQTGKGPKRKGGNRSLGLGCLLGPIVGGGISSVVGVIVGHLSSLLYTLVGEQQNTGLAYLLSGVTFLMSFVLSMGLSTVARKVGLKPK